MQDVLLYALGVLFVILGIAISIAIHELGHLWPAKAFGVRVKQYMIGFGPTVFSRTRGDTEYGIKAIPLGGYISMVGMFAPTSKPVRGPFAKMINEAREASLEEMTAADTGREFYRLHPGKKLIIMLGGPVMNLFLGVILILAALSGLGVNQTVPRITEVSECWVPVGETCTETDVKTPAYLAGLQAGDLITAIDGNDVTTWRAADEILKASNPEEPVSLQVQRGQESLTLSISPLWMETESGLAPRLGVYLDAELTQLAPAESIAISGDSLGAVFGLIVGLPAAVWEVGTSLVSGAERDPNGPISILGVGQIAGEVASADQLSVAARVSTGFMILGSLNFALFAFNLIPLIPLDGGRVVEAGYEAGKRAWYRVMRRGAPEPIDSARMIPLAYLVWVLLLGVGLLLILADLLKPVSL